MDKFIKTSEELIEFVDGNPSQFHVVDNLKKAYRAAGFKELFEGERFELQKGESYFVTRNDSAIIAFRLPKKDYKAFNITAAHSDSPTFRIKANPELAEEKAIIKLNTEKYGGLIMYPWFDRPLGIAGRVLVRNGKKVESKLIHIDRNIVMIPSLAIHMNRQINEGYNFNAQKDSLPIFAEVASEIDLNDVVAKELGVEKNNILDSDLFLTNRVKGTLWGANNEFIAAGKLDDEQCVFAGYKAITEVKAKNSILVHAVFDNEEVGSGTKQGAAGTFLFDTLTRINKALGYDEEQYHMALSKTLMLSADNAHSVHPNYTEKACPSNRPMVNKGIVIKYSANQKYTTDAVSGAIFRAILDDAKVPYQVFTNRSDILGGSTLGNISTSQVSISAVDIGVAQWAMHSPYESGGVKDTLYMIDGMKAFFETDLAEIM